MDLTAVQVKQFNADVTKTIEKFVQVSVLQNFVLVTILCVVVSMHTMLFYGIR